MLNMMRDGIHSKIIKFVLFGLLMLAAAGMAFMDVGGFFRNGVGMGGVAKVGKEEISMQAFDNSVQRIVRRQGMTAKQAYQFGMIDQILQQDINSRLLSQGAMKNGIYVGDAQVAQQIGQMVAPALKEEPGVSAKTIMTRLLQNQGMSEAELVGTIRNSMMSTMLQAAVQTGTTTASRQEALDLYRVKNETRNIDGFILTDDSVKGGDDAKDDVLNAFYEASKGTKYRIPETRTFSIAILNEDNVKASVNIPDEELKKEYEKSIASYTVAEHRIVQQAVLDKDETAKKVTEAVKSGKSLKDAVKEVTGKVTAYTGEENYTKAGLNKEIADVVFAAPVDQATAPVKTALGYHVLVVKKIIAPEKKTFESVKDDIRKDLMQGKLSQQMQTAANTIDDRLAGGEDLPKIAKETGMKVQSIGPVESTGATPDKHDAMKDFAKDRVYILKTAFEMNEGESAPVMQLSDGSYAVIHMDKVKALSYRPFTEVREELKKNWIADQRASLNRDRANKVQQEIAGGTKTLAAAAAENGFTVVPFTNLKRTTTPPANIGNDGITAIFEAGKGETVSAPVPSGYLIATIKSVDIPDPAKISDKDLQPIMDSLKKESGNDIMAAYVKYLQEKLGVKINRPLLDTMYGPESGNNPS